MDRRYGLVSWGAGEDRIRTSVQNWKEPMRWQRAAQKAGKIETVFCLSLGDIWDNEVDPLWRYQAFQVMEETPNLIYLLLSKRIGNALKMCDPSAGNRMLPENAALGATMVNQDEWDRDIDKLIEAGRELGAKFTFVSIEPMLGFIHMKKPLPDWVILGGESGPGARPMHRHWAQHIRNQCIAYDVPFFFKQWGEWALYKDEPPRGKFKNILTEMAPPKKLEGEHLFRVGKKRAGRLLDGKEWNQLPEVKQ